MKIKYLQNIKDFYFSLPAKKLPAKSKIQSKNTIICGEIFPISSAYRPRNDLQNKCIHNLNTNHELKIQSLLITPEFSIDETISNFDLTLCRVYFDGKNIKFNNIDNFFKKKLLIKIHDKNSRHYGAVIKIDYPYDESRAEAVLVNKNIERYYKYQNRLGLTRDIKNINSKCFEDYIPFWLPYVYNNINNRKNERICIYDAQNKCTDFGIYFEGNHFSIEMNENDK